MKKTCDDDDDLRVSRLDAKVNYVYYKLDRKNGIFDGNSCLRS